MEEENSELRREIHNLRGALTPTKEGSGGASVILVESLRGTVQSQERQLR